MSTTYEKVPAGYWFNVTPDHPASKGSASGYIYPPSAPRKTWRICFATCTEHASHLTGKVNDFNTLAACKHQIHLQFSYF